MEERHFTSQPTATTARTCCGDSSDRDTSAKVMDHGTTRLPEPNPETGSSSSGTTRQDSPAVISPGYSTPETPDSSFKSSFLQRVYVGKKNPEFHQFSSLAIFATHIGPPSTAPPPPPVPSGPGLGATRVRAPASGRPTTKGKIILIYTPEIHFTLAAAAACAKCVLSRRARAPLKRE